MTPLTDRRGAPAAEVSSVAPTVIVGLTLVLGVADFIYAVERIVSLALGALLTILLLPWARVVLKQDGAERSRLRRVALQVALIALAGAFMVARWSVYNDALEQPETSYAGSYRNYSVGHVVLMLIGVLLRGGRMARLVAASASRPARLMVATFGTASVVGALLLALPVSLNHVESASLLDSLFVATSAVCVTGLSTVNVADTYSFTGQLILCALIQIGGLGIMVLAAAVTMLSGQRMGVKSSAQLAEMVDAGSLDELKRTVKAIALYTLALEIAGAVLLYAWFSSMPETGTGPAASGGLAGAWHPAWAAVFHSVSAFCNASFSNFRDGLMPFTGATFVTATLGGLIVAGGLGFPVLNELARRAYDALRRRRARRLTLNTRVNLATAAALLVGMGLAYGLLERGSSMRALGFFDQLTGALFLSACSRTSGFTFVDVAAMRPATLLLTCLAMFIGAAPGSCAGGIKTTTFAVLFASYRAELRGRRPTLFDRAIPAAVIRRAMGVGFIATIMVFTIIFLLSLLEEHDVLALSFEVVSAFSTTGFSTGITSSLTVGGKLLIVATMLAGRIGPLTLGLALSAESKKPAFELPEERVMIG